MAAARRWGMVCLALAGSMAVWGVRPAAALPAPGSLRLAKVGGVVRLTWQAGTGPYAIYRSLDANDVLRPAWLVGGSAQTFFEEPLGAGNAALQFYQVDDPRPCTATPDCDDHRPCDGSETCDTRSRLCVAGTPITCNDGDICTQDRCNESTAACEFQLLTCDDGNSCTLDSCRADVGCYSRVDPLAGVGTPALIAGRSLTQFPHFEFNDVFNGGTTVELAIDPGIHPEVVGQTCDVYVVPRKGAAGWCDDPSLADVRGAPDARSFVSGLIQSNTFSLPGTAGLSTAGGEVIGRGYDVAVDCNHNARLDAGELADGLEDRAGFYLVSDLTAPGPLSVAQFEDLGPESPHCSGGGNDDMRIYHPTTLSSPSFTGTYPLVVISHGNGHCYDWYDFLGQHLASYGFIVMSHDNNTGPGIETASTTTLQFTDKILLRQDTIGGGILSGHIDSTRIAWIGHSRGGEGVARAYDRLVDEAYPTQRYSAKDIVVISSIAPTDFLGTTKSDPHGVPYHLLYGSSDGDVCGCPDNSIAQSFGLLERATGPRQSTYVHGADHNDFNCCGFDDFTGPSGTAIGRSEAQQVQKAAQLALLEHYVLHAPAAKEYLWRQWEVFRPIGVAAATVVVNELREPPSRRSFVIDDFQTQTALSVSSSGGGVAFDVAAVAEGRERENDGQYAWVTSEPLNGMARGRDTDVGRGAAFEFAAGGTRFYELSVLAAHRDFRGDTFLSLRAAQVTRHPATAAALEDLTFTVTLVDGHGTNASISIGAYGGGIEEPYQRGGYGAGAGWQDEFETIRIRLSDFLHNGTGLDLADIRTVRFEFGSGFGSAEGRIALDDIELVKE